MTRSGWCGIGFPLGHVNHNRCTFDDCPCECATHAPGAPEQTAPAREPGFYPDVDEREYHADCDSLSVSGAKLLLKAPALFRHRQDHPEHKDFFDIGTAAHALVLGVGAPIVQVDADSWRSKAATEARDAARAQGKTALLAKDHQRVQDMADALSSHTLAMRLLSDGQPEVSAYARDETTGVMRRGRFDWLGASVITDYKSCASANPVDWAGRYGVIRKFRYDMQAAFYLDLARDLGHPGAAFTFIAQEKEPPYLVSVIYVDDADLWQARERNATALEIFRECTASGVWPGYLSDTSAAQISLDDQDYRLEKIA